MRSYTIVLRIATYAHVSGDWLLTGEEPKEPWAAAVREEEAVYKAPPISISSNAHWKEPLPQQISHKSRIFIPLVSESVAARDHGSVILR
ncbi:MAG: hypothetical protein ACETWM_03635 [Candidatus Lokiarchaeia archaeon]